MTDALPDLPANPIDADREFYYLADYKSHFRLPGGVRRGELDMTRRAIWDPEIYLPYQEGREFHEWYFSYSSFRGREHEFSTSFLVDPADEDTWFYGHPFGDYHPSVNNESPMLLSGVRLSVDPKKLKSLARYRGGNHNGFIQTHPGIIEWKPGREAAAAKLVQDHVKDGLLEVAYSAFIHWSLKNNIYINADVTTIKGANQEQRREIFTTYLDSVKPVAKSRMDGAATEVVHLERELSTAFRDAGSSLKETLRVCSVYLKGKFNVDWFIRDYFKTAIWKDKYDEANAKLDYQREIMRKHHAGSAENHFSTESLQPLMKRMPTLSRIYHVPEEDYVAPEER